MYSGIVKFWADLTADVTNANINYLRNITKVNLDFLQAATDIATGAMQKNMDGFGSEPKTADKVLDSNADNHRNTEGEDPNTLSL